MRQRALGIDRVKLRGQRYSLQVIASFKLPTRGDPPIRLAEITSVQQHGCITLWAFEEKYGGMSRVFRLRSKGATFDPERGHV